jgi:hypothetical protein
VRSLEHLIAESEARLLSLEIRRAKGEAIPVVDATTQPRLYLIRNYSPPIRPAVETAPTTAKSPYGDWKANRRRPVSQGLPRIHSPGTKQVNSYLEIVGKGKMLYAG